MKREILFRGKRADNGEWVEGFYFTTPLTDGKTDSKPEDGWFFLTGKTRHVISRNSCVYEVNPETVGQFTGLTDKNGKRIFEGDVVKQTGKVNNGSSGAIMVENMRIAVCEINSTGTIMFLSNYRSDIHSSSYEVIGSIHDNPELL